MSVKLKFFIILVVFGFALPASAGPIYVYKHDGVTKFSSTPPPAGIKAQVFTAKGGSFSHYKVSKKRRSTPTRSRLFTSKYAGFISAASSRYGIPQDLIRAVIHAESAFNPQAVSHKGARGLMQIMSSNFRRLGVKDPFSPAQNINGGVKLLAFLRKRYNGKLALMLAAYNAGEGAVDKYRGIPPYKETKNYVRKVIALQKQYRAAMYG